MFLRASLGIYNLCIPPIGMIFLALNLLKIATKWIMNRNYVISIKSNINVKKYNLNSFLWASYDTEWLFSVENFVFWNALELCIFQILNKYIIKLYTIIELSDTNIKITVHYWFVTFVYFTSFFYVFLKNFLKVESVPLKV